MRQRCSARPEYAEYGPLKHRAFATADVPSGGDAVAARRTLLGNSDVTLGVSRPNESMDCFYDEPRTGKVHLPPPIHQTFQGWNFVVCSFVPRMYDYHPQANPAPYSHSNVNSDEVIYYCDGNFMSRKGIDRYDITLHPSGPPHGPQPGATEASIGKDRTDELAVMVDTFRPLEVTVGAHELEKPEYQASWLDDFEEPKEGTTTG